MQDDQLEGSVAIADDASLENMTKLKELGENLLTKPVSRMNLLSGAMEPVEGLGSNADALRRYKYFCLCIYIISFLYIYIFFYLTGLQKYYQQKENSDYHQKCRLTKNSDGSLWFPMQ